jgi:hypothetical protein
VEKRRWGWSSRRGLRAWACGFGKVVPGRSLAAVVVGRRRRRVRWEIAIGDWEEGGYAATARWRLQLEGSPGRIVCFFSVKGKA